MSGVLSANVSSLRAAPIWNRDPPLANARIEDLSDYPWPDPHDPAVVDGLREKARFIRQETDLAIAAHFARGGIFEQAKYMRGYDKILLDMAESPKFVMALFEKLTEIENGLTKSGSRLAVIVLTFCVSVPKT